MAIHPSCWVLWALQKDEIINFAADKVYVGVTDKSRDAAAYMVSRFLTRPDVRRDRFDAFLAVILQRIRVTDGEGTESCMHSLVVSAIATLFYDFAIVM